MAIIDNLEKLKKEIPEGVELIAVSKTKPVEDIMVVYNAGHKIFGENKVQEMVSKFEKLPGDIEWHMIGHLQTNKVKYIAPFVHLIHSVDSLKLLLSINKEASKNNRIIDCLMQVHIATEETKFGFSEEELLQALDSADYKVMHHIRITGLMGMATYSEDETLIRKEFGALSSLFKKIKQQYFNDTDFFKELSIGMSGDYKIAIEMGSTMVRIGSIIFGERNYH